MPERARRGPGGPGHGRGSIARRGSRRDERRPGPPRGRGVEDGTTPEPNPARPDRSDRLRPTGRTPAPRPAGRARSHPDGLDIRRRARRSGRRRGRVARPSGRPRRSDRPAEAPQEPGKALANLAATLIVAGSWGHRARFRGVTSRRAGWPRDRKDFGGCVVELQCPRSG